MLAYGPVPSRRLGRSLGINNIPAKVCTYSCAYCQVGNTAMMQVERRMFYNPERILLDVRSRIEKAKAAGEPIDYLTFVPEGEPTLDINLGLEIKLMKTLSIPIPIAVITNNSLISRQDVRDDLMEADWVSLKVDAVEEKIWRRINRPHGHLRLPIVLNEALTFARQFRGKLATETLLVRGVNDGEEHLRNVAAFLGQLNPDIAYLAIATRPPLEKWIRVPGEESLNRAYQILSEGVKRVEYLIGYEGNTFAFTGNIKEDLLSITAVHPMREDAVSAFLARAGAEWDVIHRLVSENQLIETQYQDHKYYLRKLRKPTSDTAHEQVTGLSSE
jgi:wyosine [tRNA(Phe)-imidazoG37] synthetase (radical SAM superfamily)